MEDKVTPTALEVDIVSYALEVAHHTPFEVEYTSFFEAEYIFSTSPDSEFEVTSSGTEVEQTSSEVASHSYTYQFSEATSSSNYQYNLQEEDTFDDW
ncbi:22117_t:CDS:2, partial [Gigaspora rosea]